jgi:hypothetical protein
MNLRHFWFIFLGAVVNAASTHINAKLKVTVINSCDSSGSADNNVGNSVNSVGNSINSVGNSVNSADSAGNSGIMKSKNIIGSNDSSDIQRVVLTPGKNFLITVDPCIGAPSTLNTNINGIPINTLKVANTNNSEPPKPTIVPQLIIPAGEPAAGSTKDDDIQILIDQQPDLGDLTTEDLNDQVLNFINFVDLSRQAGLNKLIKWPRLVFIGEEDNAKYKLIENLIGDKGILTPPDSALQATPRFSAAIRFTLKKDANQDKLTIKVDGEVKDNLFEALKENKTIKEAADKFTLSEKAVEVEIIGKSVPSIAFIDLPWTATTTTAENDQILAKLFEKYLKQPWNFTIAIGNGNLPFDQWKILKLARTFDENMRRIFIVSVNPPPVEEDLRIRGLILGLQQTLPVLKKGKMYYLDTEKEIEKSRSLCIDVKCGESEFIRGIQIELLRHWNANRPDALRIIKSIFDPLKIKISGYDHFWGKGELVETEGKWKALINQSIPVLHENLIFFSEDRDNSTCTGSSLDLIKESIFENKPKSDISKQPMSWLNIFTYYQDEISKLSPVPASIDWTRVKSLISDLKVQGPNREIISNLKSLILKPQLATLQIPKSRLFDLIKIQLKEKVSKALESKISLEAFNNFKNEISKVAHKILMKQLENLNNLNKEIDESDEISGWFFNIPKENSFSWSDLMRTESVDSAFEYFHKAVQIDFIQISGRQAVLQPRLIIKNLLTRRVVQIIIEELDQLPTNAKENLVKMSQESIDQLKTLQKRHDNYEKLMKF